MMMNDRTLPDIQDPDCVTPLARVHEVFGRWLGKDYDTTVLDAVLAVAAAEKLPGDPPWLMVISGPGNAKTETVQSVSAIDGAVIVSTIVSEGPCSPQRPARRETSTQPAASCARSAVAACWSSKTLPRS